VKEMNSKERALTAFAHQKPDRVPINYLSNPGIDLRLKAYYGLAADDDEGLRRKIGVDFRRIDAPYIGPQLHADVPERQVDSGVFIAVGSNTRAAVIGTIAISRSKRRVWISSRIGRCPLPTTLTMPTSPSSAGCIKTMWIQL
jgi:hypothetical protein